MAVFGEYQQFARDFMSSEGLDEVDPIAAMRAAAGAESEGGPPLFSKEFFEAQMEVVIEEKVPVKSEEHTSELQSLMRISYAVFCLKKKEKQQNRTVQRAICDINE